MRIILIVATKCTIFTLKCTEFDFGLLGNLQRFSDPLAGEEGLAFPPLLEPQSSQCREATKHLLITYTLYVVSQNVHECVR